MQLLRGRRNRTGISIVNRVNKKEGFSKKIVFGLKITL